MLVTADECFRDALRIYGHLRELTRQGVPGAEPLFHALISFFRRPRRAGEAEPTQHQLERDFMKLVHGKADGRIEIINEQPHFIDGEHTVVDDIHKGHTAVKETRKAQIRE